MMQQFEVIVIGGGFGGMYAVHSLRKAGRKVRGIEAGPRLGGVWYWNKYPGARVDLPSVDYSYAFDDAIQQEWDWTEQFAAQPELLRYIDFVDKKLSISSEFDFNTTVTDALWDPGQKNWIITTKTDNKYQAKYCVFATGPISYPKVPRIDGLDDFKGQIIYSSRWPDCDPDFTKSAVGVIGTGSTGIQIIQSLGPIAKELYVFQRTPSFSMPMRNVKLTTSYMKEVKKHYSGIRDAAWNSAVGGTRPQTTRSFYSLTPEQRQQLLEASWEQGGLAMLGAFRDVLTNKSVNDAVADFVRSKIDEVVDNPEVAEALKPRGYPIFARRPCLDTGYYETYNLPNVHLIDCLKDPIRTISDTAVVNDSGRETQLDYLILATGFDALTGAMTHININGSDGRNLKDVWNDGAYSFLGTMVSGFPNLFMTAGPNGPSVLANLIHTNEVDVDWIVGAIQTAERKGMQCVTVKKACEDEWMSRVHDLTLGSLIPQAKTWWTNSNIPGKKEGLTMFIGGFLEYRKALERAAGQDYKNSLLME